MKLLIILVTLLALALTISDIAQFRQIQNASRLDCRKDRSKQTITRKCPGAKSLEDLYNNIPGGANMVRSYAKPDFRKTLDLCADRTSGNGNDWRMIKQARAKLATPAASEQWKECDSQIKKEQDDCDNVMNLVCAFSQGTNFECANDRQFVRTTGTIENDQCFVFGAYADGRPSNSAEFRQRIRDSRADCRKESDVVNTNCRSERTMDSLIRQLPPGINWWTDIKKNTPLGKTIEKCLDREDYGWVQMRQEVTRALRGAPSANERKDCLNQLHDEQINQCNEAKKILCAYSYGQDVSCVSKSQLNSFDTKGPCDGILKAISANGRK